MNTKIFLASIALILSITMISAASYHGSFGVDTGGGSIVIGPGSCEEDWSGSFWSDCVDREQIFVCFDRNMCGTDDLKPAQCGETRECGDALPTCGDGTCNSENNETCSSCEVDCGTCSSPGGGSPGGGSSSPRGDDNNNQPLSDNGNGEETTCYEKWECGDWTNLEGECGSRECSEVNACGTEELKPLLEKDCSSTESNGITGGVVQGITNFAKSKVGGGLIFAILVVLIAVGIMNRKKLIKK